MNMLFFFLVPILAALFESTVAHIPITLMALIWMGIYKKRELVFFCVIAPGIILDSLLFRPLGVTSLFFVVVLGILFLYGKKFETHNSMFGMLFTFLATISYCILFLPSQFLPAVLTSSLVIALFFVSRLLFFRLVVGH